jgi:hypothetical protein
MTSIGESQARELTGPSDMSELTKGEKGDVHIAISTPPGSFIDEKDSVSDQKDISDIAGEIGEVYTEGPRLIDLGEDGKERPIGRLSIDSKGTCEIIFSFQKPMPITLCDFSRSRMIRPSEYSPFACAFCRWGFLALLLYLVRYL